MKISRSCKISKYYTDITVDGCDVVARKLFVDLPMFDLKCLANELIAARDF